MKEEDDKVEEQEDSHEETQESQSGEQSDQVVLSDTAQVSEDTGTGQDDQAVAAAETDADTAAEAQSGIDTLSEMLKHAISLIEDKIIYDETKEMMFQTLHSELQEHRQGMVESILKPMIKMLLPLYDGLMRLERSLASEEMSQEQMRNELELLKSEFEEVLYRMDVTPFDEHPETLDRKLHKTVKVVETYEACEDRQVAEILKLGFLCKGSVLRPEEVVIKRFKEPKEEEND